MGTQFPVSMKDGVALRGGLNTGGAAPPVRAEWVFSLAGVGFEPLAMQDGNTVA